MRGPLLLKEKMQLIGPPCRTPWEGINCLKFSPLKRTSKDTSFTKRIAIFTHTRWKPNFIIIASR
jgi:hypothetical protein